MAESKTAKSLVVRERLAAREITLIRLKSRLESDSSNLKDMVIRNHADWVALENGIVDAVADCETCSQKLDTFLATQRI